jgi:hypothetical protein
MGSGWHEWPLMIFTVFGQCVAGGFIVLALALLKGNLNAEQQQRIVEHVWPVGADGDWLYRLNAAPRFADAGV